MREACNSCIDVTDARYHETIGCVGGTIYGFCDDSHCGGTCEPVGECDCVCHTKKED